MKTLSNVQTTVKDGKVTITADIIDQKFDFPVQQVTIGHFNPANMTWPRHIQLSHEAVFVKAFGNGFAIIQDDLVKIAAKVEPKTSFPPKFAYNPDNKSLTAEVCSEIDPDFSWEVSDSIRPNESKWTLIEGENSITLNKEKVKTGQFVRCIASSEAGSMTSNPVLVS